MNIGKITAKIIATILLIGAGLVGYSYASDMFNTASTLLNWLAPCAIVAIFGLELWLIPKVWKSKTTK